MTPARVCRYTNGSVVQKHTHRGNEFVKIEFVQSFERVTDIQEFVLVLDEFWEAPSDRANGSTGHLPSIASRRALIASSAAKTSI